MPERLLSPSVPAKRPPRYLLAMVVGAAPSWEELPLETREVIEWAAACEVSSKDVGLRAILIGVLRRGGGSSPADVLLRHFGISRDQLFTALRDSIDPAVDPYVAESKQLSQLP